MTIGETDAKDYYAAWYKVTNRIGSEAMNPHLVEMLNREHPTLRQQMVAQMLTLLNSIQTEDYDGRDEASCEFLVRFQAWLEGYNDYPDGRQLYISPQGEIKFPFI